MRRITVLLVLGLLCGPFVYTQPAQRKSLTIEDIYGPGGWERFNGKAAAVVDWLRDPWVDDAHYLWPADEAAGAGGASWLKVDALSGQREVLFDPAKLAAALATVPRISSGDARLAADQRPTNFNRRHDGFLLTVGSDLIYYDIGRDRATRLTDSRDAKEEAAFSPDGASVAFVSKNNLFATTIDHPRVRALTTDGTSDLLNGTLDWVYSEELYGRGNHRAYWWSPDSSQIAFIQLDEKPVPDYPVIDDIPYRTAVETWKYPRAGDPNPIAKVGVVPATGGTVRWADTGKYSDFLIVDAGWTPDSRKLCFQVQDRRQSWLDFDTADRTTGRTTTLFRETSQTWVERWDNSSADPVWLKDGTFLWLSERSGWRHLYHYRPDGTIIKQVTDGRWEVRSVHGVDEAAGWIYFSGTERSVLDSHVYRIRLDGAGLQRVTSRAGRHSAFFNPARSLFLDSWSDAAHPYQVTLHRSDGSQARVVEANPAPALDEYAVSAPEFVQVKARDGFVMEAMMIKPPGFDPSRRYPVYQVLYGGPHLQHVVNGWSGTEYLYEQLLAEHGIVVWACDNRTASGKGAVSAWPAYKHLGELELRDIEDCVGWLKAQPYVDGARIGIEGASYGGYMTIFALTHPSSFTMGIACCPIADWRDYDTIYTERYMGLPQENAEGYKRSSPRFNAGDLHGPLLLLHGEIDDNVHLQNSMQLAYELQRAGKQFEMMIYPKSRHGITDPELHRHERQLMLDFTLRNLKP
ncbi:MAG TPA: S9 family peptidase [Vicinamibacterales bacterium]|jgi:dipeptidyl-peptidase-4|nr:S9 family peptidase [Vicinamibacterales bacterium]